MAFRRVITVGLDGLEPTIVEAMMAAGELPHLAGLRGRGGYARITTTYPAQTPVAWSTFATGVNPGGHGIFDFLRRDPATYLPDPALSRYEQKSAFMPPKAVNLRGGTPLWTVLGRAGIPSVVIRCPCTYPPDDFKGRMLSGMGVPDVRGGFGTSSFYTTNQAERARESEAVIPVTVNAGRIRTHLIGPRNPKGGGDATFDLAVELSPAARSAVIRTGGEPDALEVKLGAWSDWLKVKFKLGMLQAVHGMVRFHLVSLDPFELYASPINFDPGTPMFPISHPWDYAGALQQDVGTYYTTGMVEDHGGLNNGRFGEAAYLDQCAQVMREREAMLQHELGRARDGFVFCLFDTPDRLQHMLWRFREPGHPANTPGDAPELARAIEEHYRTCDAMVGRVLAQADEQTLVIVLSDHGFGSFQRGVNLNTWLLENGFLFLKPGVMAGEGAGDFLRGVDWDRTRAYAVGLGSMYLNVRGREANGIVPPAEATALAADIQRRMAGLVDAGRGALAVRGVALREEIYRGPFAPLAPDLVALFAPGYRVSWSTALGGVSDALIEDNAKRWGGDHIMDPPLVPGVLFMSSAFRPKQPRLLDMAPTILAALGVPAAPEMEGASLL